VWLIWQHHATANLWARGYRDLKIRPGWAVGWWFIPFANLVMPCVAMVELDRRSTTDGSPRSTSPLVGSWWAVYVGGSVVVTIGLVIAVLSGLASFVLGRWLSKRRRHKKAEQARAASDNAYRNALGMSSEQFIQLEAIHAQREICLKGGCTLIMGGSTPLVNVGTK